MPEVIKSRPASNSKESEGARGFTRDFIPNLRGKEESTLKKLEEKAIPEGWDIEKRGDPPWIKEIKEQIKSIFPHVRIKFFKESTSVESEYIAGGLKGIIVWNTPSKTVFEICSDIFHELRHFIQEVEFGVGRKPKIFDERIISYDDAKEFIRKKVLPIFNSKENKEIVEKEFEFEVSHQKLRGKIEEDAQSVAFVCSLLLTCVNDINKVLELIKLPKKEFFEKATELLDQNKEVLKENENEIAKLIRKRYSQLKQKLKEKSKKKFMETFFSFILLIPHATLGFGIFKRFYKKF